MMEKAISLFRKNKFTFLVYIIPFSIIFLGNYLVNHVYSSERPLKYFGLEAYQIIIAISLIPILFLKEYTHIRIIAIVMMVNSVMPFYKINSWFANTEPTQYIADSLGIHNYLVLGFILCLAGFFHHKTRSVALFLMFGLMFYTIFAKYF
ncbi:MAG: hypothetical protein U5N85_11160 [Arcicella sp.]|nr:hypothetical protein [Arcicella sp.]